jgi:hypothetical protein
MHRSIASLFSHRRAHALSISSSMRRYPFVFCTTYHGIVLHDTYTVLEAGPLKPKLGTHLKNCLELMNDVTVKLFY